MKAITKAAIATYAVLALFGCAPGPVYIATKVACSDASLAFDSLSLDGSSGITDLTGTISEATAIQMLAERRVKFVEQKSLSTVLGPPLALLVKTGKNDAFAKVWIDKIGSSACITKNEHMSFGTTYDLFIQGMAPTECLAGEAVAQASGRYQLEARYDDSMGVLRYEYVVMDRTVGGKVAAIQGAEMKVSNAAAKSPFPHGPYASCRANVQTVANLFFASQRSLNTIPDLREIDTARPVSGLMRFTRTQMPREKFLALDSVSDTVGSALASKGPPIAGQRSILINDGEFIGHFAFPAAAREMRPSSTKVGVLLFGVDTVTHVWRTGEVSPTAV